MEGVSMNLIRWTLVLVLGLWLTFIISTEFQYIHVRMYVCMYVCANCLLLALTVSYAMLLSQLC